MIVIPMAGESRRFTQAGYDRPKYMLPLNGESLFSWSVRSFKALFSTEEFLFVLLGTQGAKSFVESELRTLGVRTAHVVELDAPTIGQAATVEQGLKLIDCLQTDTPITVFNIDTIRPNFSFPQEFDQSQVDGYLEVFRGPGEHWSFVEPKDDDFRVQRTTEKERISDLCCTGIYYFKTARLFSSALDEQRGLAGGGLVKGEAYIAPIYNRLIERGADIRYRLIESNEVEFSGTPSEYDDLRSKWQSPSE